MMLFMQVNLVLCLVLSPLVSGKDKFHLRHAVGDEKDKNAFQQMQKQEKDDGHSRSLTGFWGWDDWDSDWDWDSDSDSDCPPDKPDWWCKPPCKFPPCKPPTKPPTEPPTEPPTTKPPDESTDKPEPCELTVKKSCGFPKALPPDSQCKGRLKRLDLIWDGEGPVKVTAISTGTFSPGTVQVGDEITLQDPFGSNDFTIDLELHDGKKQKSEFHVSCSDKEMDGNSATGVQVSDLGRDCLTRQGNGKGNGGNLNNDWLLAGFVDANNVQLDCTPPDAEHEEDCEIQAIAADCDIPGPEPDSLTWIYTGGGCEASNNDQKMSDATCEGSIDGTKEVSITDDKGNRFAVQPNGIFTTSRDASKKFKLRNDGGTEELELHVSCSQPLQVGDIFGSLTIALLDGRGLGGNINYSFTVRNDGALSAKNVEVIDDQLGRIGMVDSLGPGASKTLSKTAFITESTTNIASAQGTASNEATCSAQSNQVQVTVLPPDPCDVTITLKEFKENESTDKIEWEITNNAELRRATMENFELTFPSSFGRIKEVKLDGTVFKSSDSTSFKDGVPSGSTIGEDDWTESEVEKRQLDPSQKEKLEVTFTKKGSGKSKDFDLILDFEEDCSVTF